LVRLIVSEKPSMGRAIAAALGIQGSGRGAIQGQGVIVTWCVGHLVEALAPEGYDPALKQWRMDALPFFPDTFRYAPIESTKDQYQTVAGLMNRDDVVEIVNATDAGREGELIFDLVYRLAGVAKPVLRFWTSSLTDAAILEAYGRMKPGESYRGLRDAARCRQEADWLVGINCTRAQTLAQRRSGGEGVYSVGRVQTPTLALMVNRELEIQNFVPKDFWTLWATFQAPAGSYKGKWFRKEGDRFDTEAEARAMVAALAGKPGRVASVTARTEKRKPELLYDLTALQKEANKRFGFTAEHTLEVAQALYEAKLISYPRTNSRCLTEADALKIPGWIKAIGQGQLAALHPFVDDLRKRWPVRLDKRFVNDKEVEDHTALVPTESPARTLQGDQLRVYELIARRFLAAHWPDRIEAKTTLITKIEKESFKTTGTVVKDLGWSEVDPPHGRPKKDKPKGAAAEETEPDEDEDSGTLPAVAKDEAVQTTDLAAKAGQTTPPKRMSEADLLGAMQSAGKELDDEGLKGAMKDCGLGTPATRANIIETLLKRAFVERKRNILQPTAKGIELVQSIQAEALKSPQLTGEWEAQMERIRRGEAERPAFMEGIHSFVREVVGQIKGSAPQGGARRSFGPVAGPCPRCGADLHLRDWEGRHYVKCSAAGADPECRLAYDTDPEGKPLELCRLCQGPVRTTKGGAKVCVLCGKWAADLDPQLPEAGVCAGCGQPMRLIPSTARGKFFRRCAPCGILVPV